MKKISKIVVSTVTLIVTVVSLTIPALAATVDVQGGVWNYGVGSKYVWSYYSHNSKTHKASVHGAYDATSGWIRKGVEAKASAEKALFGNASYYDVK